jgi:hypothetical protein
LPDTARPTLPFADALTSAGRGAGAGLSGAAADAEGIMAGESRSFHGILGRTRTLMFVGTALGLVMLLGVLGFQLSTRQGMAAVQTNAGHRLELFASAIEGMLNRLEHVPATVQLNKDVLALLSQGAHPERTQAVNAYLKELNAQVGSTAVYVLNERGIVVATSNSGEPGSFMGEDLAFRPYFIDALSGKVGRHFAIGNTSGVPGYYLSNPVREGRKVVGVAVIKITLGPIEQAWSMLGVPALIADENLVVILSSQPEWRYNTLRDPLLTAWLTGNSASATSKRHSSASRSRRHCQRSTTPCWPKVWCSMATHLACAAQALTCWCKACRLTKCSGS